MLLCIIPAEKASDLERMHDSKLLIGFSAESICAEILAHGNPPYLYQKFIMYKAMQGILPAGKLPETCFGQF